MLKLLPIALILSLTGSFAESTLLTKDWKFARFGAMADGSTLAEPDAAKLADPAFDDSGWRTLDLPHDWGIEGPFRQDLPGNTGKLPWAGIGWYRKSFDVPADAAGKTYYLDIDGAMSDSTVYLNGTKVGGWAYGYSSFRVDLTPALKPGTKNELAIRLDNQPDSSRWYPGGGLYRDVHLVVKDGPAHFSHNGIFVQTPKVSPESAEVLVKVEMTAGSPQQGVVYQYRILDADGKVLVEQTSDTPSVSLVLSKPRLWTLEDPHLYQLVVSATRDGKVLDKEAVRFGVRSLAFDVDKGFLLNGRRTYLQGVCMHHDLGPLGAAFQIDAARRQLTILKEMGVNAVRLSHNPPAPGFVELCDEMGILLMVESFDCWDARKTPNDYARHFKEWHERDLRLMVRNFRNHPSVIMWSIGNEITGPYQRGPQGPEMAGKLREIVRSEDSTRPVTMGNNKISATEVLWQGLDLLGLNYKPGKPYEEFHARKTGVPVYGSETASTLSSRGEYFFPAKWSPRGDRKGGKSDFQVSSYDLSVPGWGCPPDYEFAAQDKCQPWMFGEFVWTGFDYLGEPTPYNADQTNLLNFQNPKQLEEMQKELDRLGKLPVPSRSSYFGIVDLCGFKKDRFYLYQAKWRPDLPMAHILPHWNWPDRVGQITPVHVYTSGDEAELFLNGKSLGRKKRGQFEYRIMWEDVKYEPGELKVVAYKNGKEWATDDRSTTGPAAKIQLETETVGKLSFVTATIVDGKGREVPGSHPNLQFSASGDAQILAAGNGDATSHVTMHRAKSMPAYNGKCLVILEGKGGLNVAAEGLPPASVAVAK